MIRPFVGPAASVNAPTFIFDSCVAKNNYIQDTSAIQMSDIYYKYRADSEYTEAVFTSGKVFLSTAAGLNDPFECSLQDIATDWIKDQVAQMKQAALAGFVLGASQAIESRGDFFGLEPTVTAQLVNRMRGYANIDDAYRFYAQFIEERTGHPPSNPERLFANIDAQLNAVGIFSMSRKPDHPLMWAHYATDAGVCIGFERAPGTKMADESHFLPVIYSDVLPELAREGLRTEMSFSMDENQRPYVSSFRVAFTDPTFRKAITTKPSVWEYEDEWRYVEPFDGLYEWPGLLTELTFGIKCSDRKRRHYIQLAEDNVPNEVRLFEMRRVHGTNSLQRVPLDPPTTHSKYIARQVPVLEDGTQMGAKEFVALMESWIKRGRVGPALYAIQQNLQSHPNSPVLLSLQGTAYGADGQHAKARDSFVKLTKVSPDAAQGWYQLSVALTELGEHDEAVAALRRAFSLNPDDASTVFNLGVELLRTQDTPDEGLVFLRRAERLGHRRAHVVIAHIEELEASRRSGGDG